MLLVNLPLANLMVGASNGQPGGLLHYLYLGTKLGIYPPLIFLCLGAATDFEPLLANPYTILLGGAAQFGIFAAFFLEFFSYVATRSGIHWHYWWGRWSDSNLFNQSSST